MKKTHLTLIAAAVFVLTLHPSMAQAQSDGDSDTPATTRMRVENIQSRHDKALADLVATFERIAKEPQLISSKEVVDAIDLGDRTLKSTKAGCDAILTSLRAEAKTIKSESSFSDDQKTELLATTENLNAKCEDLAKRTAATIQHLEGAYKAMGKWRKIYKTYLNLDGETKANEQLKTSVQEFVKGLTPAPDAFDSAPAKAKGGDKAE